VRGRLLISSAIFLAYCYSFPYFTKLRSANELPRIFLTTEIVDSGTFRIDGRQDQLGSRFDVATTPHGLYSNKAPGLSFVAVPVYLLVKAGCALAGITPSLAVLTWIFRVAAVTVPAALFLPLFCAFARRFAPTSASARGAGLAAYALGSMAFPYSLLFYSHQLAAVCAAASLCCAAVVTRGPIERRAPWCAAVGALASLAVLVDYQAALAGAVIGIYLLARSPRRGRDAAWAVCGAAPAGFLLAVYHTICFGHPLRTGYSFAVDPAHKRGVLGIVGPNAEAMWNATLAPDNGLITFSPWIILAGVGAVAIARDPDARARIGAEALVCGAIVALYVLFIGSLVPEFGRGGWSVGPRYIVVAMPFAAWLAVAGLAAAEQRSASHVAALALIWVGAIVFTAAAATYPHWPTPHFANPLYEVSFRLIREGMAPHSLGTWLGLTGRAALAPLFILVAALVAYLTSGGRGEQWRRVALAAAVAAALVASYSQFPGPRPLGDRGWRFIESTWEPGFAGPDHR
jgi:hypothetical protein